MRLWLWVAFGAIQDWITGEIVWNDIQSSISIAKLLFPCSCGLERITDVFSLHSTKSGKMQKGFLFFFFLLHAYITGFYSAMFWPWGLILYWDAWQTLAQHILFDIWISRGRAHCNHMPQLFELQYIFYCLNSKNCLGFQDLCIKFLFDIKKKPKNPCTYINSNPV